MISETIRSRPKEYIALHRANLSTEHRHCATAAHSTPRWLKTAPDKVSPNNHHQEQNPNPRSCYDRHPCNAFTERQMAIALEPVAIQIGNREQTRRQPKPKEISHGTGLPSYPVPTPGIYLTALPAQTNSPRLVAMTRRPNMSAGRSTTTQLAI
jgi:hypothetical protein